MRFSKSRYDRNLLYILTILKRSKAKMLDTDRILEIALDMVGWKSVPADTAIHVPGRNLNKVMLMIDVSTADLMLAKNLGCDAVITHHPIGIAAVNFYKVIDRHIDYMIENGISENTARMSVMDLKRRV